MYSQTPVYYAAREGKLNVLQILVESGAYINTEDKYGQTCIFYAIKEGHYEIVEYLVQKGADINKVDKKKLTPYTFALKHNKIRIADLLVSSGVVINSGKQTTKKVKTTTKPEEDVKTAVDDNQPKKYILVRVLDNGEKVALSQSEIEQLLRDNIKAGQLLSNKEALEKEEDNISQEYNNIYHSLKLGEHVWEKQAKKIMNNLWKFKDAEIFHKPVNPVELHIPDYFDIIKNPMDYSTVKV
jgi:ankyrin repeat protein